MQNPDSANPADEIKQKILAGDKIGAIKLYREQTHVGLAEAKNAVEQMQTQLRGFASAELALPKATEKAPTQNAAIAEALFAGKKIAAIKLYRAQTQAELADAKRAVEEIEKQLRLSAPGLFANPPRKGCLAAIALLASVGGLVWKALGA